MSWPADLRAVPSGHTGGDSPLLLGTQGEVRTGDRAGNHTLCVMEEAPGMDGNEEVGLTGWSIQHTNIWKEKSKKEKKDDERDDDQPG